MKKWMSLFVACIIGICVPQITFADEAKSKTEEEQIFLEKLEELELKYKREYEEMLETYGSDPGELLKEVLSEEYFGGEYVGEDGTLHIIPVNKEEVAKAISFVRSKTNLPIVMDEECVKYSYAELLEVSDRVFDHFEEFYFQYGVWSFYPDIKKNCLVINSNKPWTKEAKQNVLKTAKIKEDTVEFVELPGGATPEEASFEQVSSKETNFDINEEDFEIPLADPMLEELIQMQIDLSNKES